MKNLMITIIFLLSINTIFSQSYIPLLQKANQWNLLYVDDSFSPEHTFKTWQTIKCQISDSIVIDGIQYLKVGGYYYREDTTEKKIYLRHETEEDAWDELLYDFGMMSNDTMVYYRNSKDGEIHYVIRVDSIRNITLGTEFKTREYYISCKSDWIPEFNGCGSWIEGIGSFQGLNPKLKIGIDGDDFWHELLCFSKNGNLIYLNPEYESCDENYNAVNENPYQKINILANPVSEKLEIELPDDISWDSYVITGISARVLLSNKVNNQPKLTIDVSSLHFGIYFIRLSKGDGKIAVGKFVVAKTD